jgi:hypothetical protein
MTKTFNTATISEAISTISFDDDNSMISISFNSRPENVYAYTVSDYESIKEDIMNIIDVKASGGERSLGSYVSRLMKSDNLELVSA